MRGGGRQVTSEAVTSSTGGQRCGGDENTESAAARPAAGRGKYISAHEAREW